jgi:hypothetical protein
MLGVLVAIFRFNRATLRSGILRKSHVPRIVGAGIAVIPAGLIPSLSVLVVESHSSALAVSRRRSSLRPCIPVLESLNLRRRTKHMRSIWLLSAAQALP